MEEVVEFPNIKVEHNWNLSVSPCLICSQLQDAAGVNQLTTSSFLWSDSNSSCPCASVHPNVLSIFVLKTILNYPEEEIVKLFEQTGGDNPSDWMVLCQRCLKLSAGVYQLQIQVNKLQKQLTAAQNEMRNQLNENVRKCEKKSDEPITRCNLNPRTKIRNYFKMLLRRRENKPENEDEEFCGNVSNASCDLEDDQFSDEWSPPIKVTLPYQSASDSEAETSFHSKTFARRNEGARGKKKKKASIASKLKRKALSAALKKQKALAPKAPLRDTFSSCDQCSFKSRSDKRIISHQQNHQLMNQHVDTSNENSFRCKLCNWSTDTKPSILSHLRNSHVTSTSDTAPPTVVVSKPKMSTKQPFHQAIFDKYISQGPDGKLACKLCDRSYAQNRFALHHMRKSHPEIWGEGKSQCKICYRIFSFESELEEHIASGHTNIKSFLCSKCPYVTRIESHFNRHSQTHEDFDKFIKLTSNGWFGCKLCDESAYESKRGIVHHLSKFHPEQVGQEGFQCHLCHKAYGSRRGLDSHINTKHGSSQPFPCNLCSQGFASEGSLAYHLKSHKVQQKKRKAKEEPSICTRCGLTFALKAAMNKHIRKFHGDAGSTLSAAKKCAHCDITCINLRAFKLHLREVHPHLYKYRCDQCDAIYVTNVNLQSHIRTVHLQEKVECSQCFKLMTMASLREHLKVFCKGPKQNQT